MAGQVMEQMILGFERNADAEAKAPPAAVPSAASSLRPATRRGRRPVATISEPQRRTLAKIVELTQRAGYPPTIREVAAALGVAIRSTHQQMQRLVRKGYISRAPRKARSIRIERPLELDATPQTAGAGLTSWAQQSLQGQGASRACVAAPSRLPS
jgi:hypothetical protein